AAEGARREEPAADGDGPPPDPVAQPTRERAHADLADPPPGARDREERVVLAAHVEREAGAGGALEPGPHETVAEDDEEEARSERVHDERRDGDRSEAALGFGLGARRRPRGRRRDRPREDEERDEDPRRRRHSEQLVAAHEPNAPDEPDSSDDG